MNKGTPTVIHGSSCCSNTYDLCIGKEKNFKTEESKETNNKLEYLVKVMLVNQKLNHTCSHIKNQKYLPLSVSQPSSSPILVTLLT